MEGQDTCGKGGNCYWSSSCLCGFAALSLLALGVYSLRLAIPKTYEGGTVMIAMNFIEVIIFIIGPAAFVLFIVVGIWVEKSDHPLAVKQRRYNAEYQPREQSWDPEESYGGLKYEMREYYRRENNRRDE
jgi:hypothetical protein